MERAAGVVDPIRVVLADGSRPRGRRHRPTRRAALRVALGTVLALVGFLGAGYVAGTHVAEQEALRDVRRLSSTVANVLVEPNVDAIMSGDAKALASLDAVVRTNLLQRTPVRRVKLWSADGRVLYSDASELIGNTYPLAEDKREVLETGRSATEVSDLDREENLFERSLGSQRLLEVYTRVSTRSGPVLFESYLDYEIIQERRVSIFRSFAWVALLGFLIFVAVQTSAVFVNVRWLRQQRAKLLERSAQVADNERRRVARDLHDGVVQDLVGASYVVNGAVAPLSAAGRADLAESLRGSVSAIRTSIGSLRSMIIDIYPASLTSAGLRAALHDLVTPLQRHGIEVALDLPEQMELPAQVEAAFYRTAQEAVRNARVHGHAASITIRVRISAGRATLVVKDDGDGYDPRLKAATGHFGLLGLADVAEEAGGVLEVVSAPGWGTEVRMELPT